jgi:hypothetical protein
MNEQHTTGYDQRGWGYGLATWVLAAYTAEGDIVLDLDADPGIRIATEMMHRAYLTGLTPSDASGTPLGGVRLVTAHWPRPHTTPTATRSGNAPEHAELTAIAGLLVPGAWLAVVAPLPAPAQPFTVHSEPLLSAAHAAGLGHLRAVHITAADTTVPGDPAYRCALIFRRTGHPHHPGAEASAAWTTEPADG